MSEVPRYISPTYEDTVPGPSTHEGGVSQSLPRSWETLPQSHLETRCVWYPTHFPAPRDQRSSQLLWFSRSLGSRGGRKLVVLTHRTRESSPGNSTHFISMVLGCVAPLPLRGSLTRLGVCGGVGHRQTCLLSPPPQPNPISPIDFQAHDKHSYSLATASPEWRLS